MKRITESLPFSAFVVYQGDILSAESFFYKAQKHLSSKGIKLLVRVDELNGTSETRTGFSSHPSVRSAALVWTPGSETAVFMWWAL